jgi:dissimilatory sulfite reductase (desulfoviridin) alpha/beta subunit
MVEELFFDLSEMLWDIYVCPVKYGSQSKEVADGILSIVNGLRAIFEREDLDRIVADLSRIPLCQSSGFSVAVAGCANCCEPPFFRDLGIIGQHVPEVIGEDCLQCGKCVNVCFEDAIALEADGPVIDRNRCINCEFCGKTCPSGKIVIGKRGYKVTAGGRDYRHPAVGQTVAAFTDKQGVLRIAQRVVELLKKGREGDTLKSLVGQHGVDALR